MPDLYKIGTRDSCNLFKTRIRNAYSSMNLDRALRVMSCRFSNLNISGLLSTRDLRIRMSREPIPRHGKSFIISISTSSKRKAYYRSGSIFIKEYGIRRTLHLLGFFPELERGKGLGMTLLSLLLLKGNRYAGWKVNIFCPSLKFLEMAEDMDQFIFSGSKLADIKNPPIENEDLRLRVPPIGSMEIDAIDHIWSLLRASEEA